MLDESFLSWLFIGFSLAAAVGPIWLLVAQRTLAKGWRYGIASGAGVALADGLYGLAGAMGLQVLVLALNDMSGWLRLMGGSLLAGIGLRTLLAAGQVRAAESSRDPNQESDELRAAGSIFLLTLANPMTMLSFAAVYTGAGETGLGLGSGSPWAFAGAISSGSMLWWTILVGGISAARRRISPGLIAWISRAAGLTITLLGASMALRALRVLSG